MDRCRQHAVRPLQRGIAQLTVVAAALAIAAAIIGWLYWQQRRPRPLVVSGFVEADQIRVGSRVGGRVVEVLVQEGRQLKAGDVLFRIDPFDLRQRLAQAEAERAQAQSEHDRLKAGYRSEEIAQAQARRDRAAATLQKLKAGPRKQEIEMAHARLEMARANLGLAESEHARIARLEKVSQAAQIEIDRAVRGYKSAQAEVAAAEQELKLLEEGTRPEEIAEAVAALADADAALRLLEAGYRAEDIAQAAAAVDAAQARVAAIKVQLDELVVRAPLDCVVEAIDLHPGDLVPANAPSCSLLDLSTMWVRSYVPESRLASVRMNQTIPVTADGLPGRRFVGRVTFIASEAEFTPRNIQTPEERSKQVFRIKVTLDEGKDVLRVGMPVDVHLAE